MNDNEKISFCFGCFRPKQQDEATCSICGYRADSQAETSTCLAPGTLLHGRYLLGRQLGQGGFGITYLALDQESGQRVAVKEYYPDGIVTRGHGELRVKVYTEGLKENFELGVRKFIKESQVLAKFHKNPNIIHVQEYFLENGTAYYVMEYVDGISLKRHLLQSGGRLPVSDVFRIVFPILDALDEIHQSNVLHRDISPDNIYLTKDGVPKLLDFGAARQVFTNNDKSLSIMLKPGFAPEEQYRKKGVQGPWTDIYSLGATMYFALTGEYLPDALDRLRDDSGTSTVSKLMPQIGAAVDAVVMKAVAPAAEDRYASVREFRNALVAAVVTDGETDVRLYGTAAKRRPTSLKPAYRVALVAVSVIVLSTVTVFGLGMSGTADPFGIFKGGSLENTDYDVTIMATSAQLTPSSEATISPDITDTEYVPSVSTSPLDSPTTNPSSGPSTTTTPYVSATPTVTLAPVPLLLFANTKAGDIVIYGSFEQDNILSNGKEPISWRVLEVRSGKALLLSEKIIDTRVYDTTPIGASGEEVKWASCTLRTWLNADFLETAFKYTDTASIETSLVMNPNNPEYGTFGGPSTKDKVFLLSIEEANGYFADDIARSAIITQYAKMQGSLDMWWLRSPGFGTISAAGVTNGGTVSTRGWDQGTGNVGVRPAIWVYIGEPSLTTTTPDPTPSPVETIAPSEQATPTIETTTIPPPSIRSKVGDLVSFGIYEQDNVLLNGKEPIVWRVLDVTDEEALLLSDKNLDAKLFDTTSAYVAWDDCTLRTWLNKDFLLSSFRDFEASTILSSSITTPDNTIYGTTGGAPTIDKVFLLSIEEANRYFSSDASRIALNTVFAKAQGANDFSGAGGWWLRSPGSYSSMKAMVFYFGTINVSGSTMGIAGAAVRPAIRVNLAS